jgi:hypothetical protein
MIAQMNTTPLMPVSGWGTACKLDPREACQAG